MLYANGIVRVTVDEADPQRKRQKVEGVLINEQADYLKLSSFKHSEVETDLFLVEAVDYFVELDLRQHFVLKVLFGQYSFKRS
jgi:hypothetical protein